MKSESQSCALLSVVSFAIVAMCFRMVELCVLTARPAPIIATSVGRAFMVATQTSIEIQFCWRRLALLDVFTNLSMILSSM